MSQPENEAVWDEWMALQEIPEYDDNTAALFASRNKGFWGLFKRLYDRTFVHQPTYVTEKWWDNITFRIHERELNAITILFWPLYFVTLPISLIGGIIEFTYNFITAIATGDTQHIAELFTTIDTTGVIGTMINGIGGFIKIPTVWWYDTGIQVGQVSWNWSVYAAFLAYFAGVDLSWVQVVYYEEVGWVIFDNFYTGLQFQTLNYDQFLENHFLGFFTALTLFPFVWLYQWVYYLFAWPE